MNLLASLNQRPIAYYPVYRKVMGSTTGGVLLSQLMYWFSMKNKFYKCDAEIREECLLGDRELRTAKAKIKELPFIVTSKEGVPAKTFYEINWDNYAEYVSGALETEDDGSQPEWTKGPNCDGRKVPTITKTTSKTSINNNEDSPKWKNSLEEYKEYLREGYRICFSDTSWLDDMNNRYPDYDVTETIKKALREYWIDESAFEKQRKQKKKSINFKNMFNNVLCGKISKKVYKKKYVQGNMFNAIPTKDPKQRKRF